MKKKLILSGIFIIGMLFCVFYVNGIISKYWWVFGKYNINIIDAWKIKGNTTTVTVGVIDSGVEITSPFLSGSIFCNAYEDEDNEDNDGNGFADDVHGWNFYENSNVLFSSYTSDYHGTLISGIIAGKNSFNHFFGVAPNVNICVLKCFRGTEGDVDDIVKAIEYGYSLGIRIFNCSWASTSYSEKLYNVIKKYDDAIFICACGLDSLGQMEGKVYPACFDLKNVVSVGAYDKSGRICQYSCEDSLIDVYAPGTDIYCILPKETFEYCDGTSLATAFVTGAVALDKSIHEKGTDELLYDIKEVLNTNGKMLDVSLLCGIKSKGGGKFMDKLILIILLVVIPVILIAAIIYEIIAKKFRSFMVSNILLGLSLILYIAGIATPLPLKVFLGVSLALAVIGVGTIICLSKKHKADRASAS